MRLLVWFPNWALVFWDPEVKLALGPPSWFGSPKFVGNWFPTGSFPLLHWGTILAFLAGLVEPLFYSHKPLQLLLMARIVYLSRQSPLLGKMSNRFLPWSPFPTLVPFSFQKVLPFRL